MILEDSFYQYKNNIGVVKFVSKQYITLCISSAKSRINDVCLVIYKSDWKNLIPVDDPGTVHKPCQIP
jgi:hypothetical protein